MEDGTQGRQQESSSEIRAKMLNSAENKTIGCLGYLLGGFLGALLLTMLFSPWAFYIGGHFSPTASWEGSGKVKSSTGANYGMYLKLTYYTARRSSRNLTGGALLCTPQGETFQYNIYGWIEHAWLSTESQHTKLDLWKVKGARVDTSFHLEGKWQDGELVLKDNGSLGVPFRADGSVQAKGIYGANPIKNEHADVSVAYGTKLDFDELCANEIVKK
jgi:hypothetical protein